MKGINYMQLTAKVVLNKLLPYFQLFKTSYRLSKNLYNIGNKYQKKLHT